MKKIIASFVLLLGLVAAWSVWPFYGLYDLGRAIQAADADRIEQRIDFPQLRRSLSSQVMTAYARINGIKVDNSGLMVGLGASIADPLVEKLLTPEAIARLMSGQWPNGLSGDAPRDLNGLDFSALGSAWQIYLASDYGLGEFRVPLPLGVPVEQQFRIRLELSGLTWKLSGLDLPQPVQERLARELTKNQQTKPAA
jgi:hypothetical protein